MVFIHLTWLSCAKDPSQGFLHRRLVLISGLQKARDNILALKVVGALRVTMRDTLARKAPQMHIQLRTVAQKAHSAKQGCLVIPPVSDGSQRAKLCTPYAQFTSTLRDHCQGPRLFQCC